MKDDLKEFEKLLDEPKAANQIININVSETVLKENILNVVDHKTLMNDIENTRKTLEAQFGPVVPKESKLVKIPKNLVLVYKSDSSGCGYIRCTQIFNFIDYTFGKDQKLMPVISPHFVFSEEILMKTRSIFFQRHMNPDHLKHIKKYKELQSKFKYKMVWEIDDSLWDWTDDKGVFHKGVPEYNFGQTGITNEVQAASIEIMNMMDTICVSTEYLKHFIQEKLKITVPVQVNQNVVAKYLWEYKKEPIKDKIKKPKIIYAGSPTHYLNLNEKSIEKIRANKDSSKGNEKGLYGDFENPALREYIIKNVLEDKIEFVVYGGVPFFFESIKDKIKVHNWYTPVQFHYHILKEKADFSLMPLVPNTFNSAKSDLRAIEAMAAGIIPIGFDFDFDNFHGPYTDIKTRLPWNCSYQQIENLINSLCEPELHNKTVQENYEYMDNNSRYLESSKFVNNFVKIL